MLVFVTGGTGFIGGHVVRALRERGDDVRALVRDPNKGLALGELGCELVSGDLADRVALEKAMEGCEAVVHGAAVYEVGIPESERRAMYEANVAGTENALRAVLAAKVPKAVYISTVAVFGNTRGKWSTRATSRPGATSPPTTSRPSTRRISWPGG
jgi:dihydroflavonol-4-reductase